MDRIGASDDTNAYGSAGFGYENSETDCTSIEAYTKTLSLIDESDDESYLSNETHVEDDIFDGGEVKGRWPETLKLN